MKPALLLAMIPLALMGTLTPEPHSPWTGVNPPTIAAQADSFKQRFEPAYPANTFEERWWPGDGSFAPQPLTFEQRWEPVEQAWGRRVRTITISKPPPEPSQEALGAIATAVPLPQPRSKGGETPPVVSGGIRPTVKPRPIRVADICTRHGLRKVTEGKTWRCRK